MQFFCQAALGHRDWTSRAETMVSCQPDQTLGGKHRVAAFMTYSRAQNQNSQWARTHKHTHTCITVSVVHPICMHAFNSKHSRHTHVLQRRCFPSDRSFTGVEVTSQVCPTSDRAGLGCFGSFKPAAGTRFSSGLDKSVTWIHQTHVFIVSLRIYNIT